MDTRHPAGTLISASLLGTTAVAGMVSGAIFIYAGWAVTEGAFGIVTHVSGSAPLLIGLLLFGYAALAGVAAWLLWTGRPAGRLLGMVVGIVAVLAAMAALISGNVQDSAPLLWIAAALGVTTVVPLLVPGTSQEAAS